MVFLGRDGVRQVEQAGVIATDLEMTIVLHRTAPVLQNCFSEGFCLNATHL